MPQPVLVFLVWAVVAFHFAFTLTIPLGGFAVWRWRGLFWPHMVLIAWAISIPLLNPSCPLTDLEKLLRSEAGMPVYATHFIDHYVYRPLQPYPWLFEVFMGATPIYSYSRLARRRGAGRSAASEYETRRA